MKKRLFVLMLLLTVGLAVRAQVDTEFWFAAPDLEAQHAQQPIRFCISSFETAATVVFEQPANPNYTTQTFHLGANDFYVYDVSNIIGMVETQPYNTVLNTGFHITSTTPVEVYYESNNNNSEIYSLKGANALGTSFLVPMQFTYNNNFASTCSRIEVVATQDATTVTFVPSQDIKGGGLAGVPVTVMLNRGQSYAIESSSPNADKHLRNTWITSDKPIAVNTSDDSVYHGGNYDLVGDQIVPVDLIGYEYLALWNNTPREYLYIFPIEDNTEIYFNGSQNSIRKVNTGDECVYPLDTPAVYVHADKPIAVFQLACANNNSSEFGGTMLPHISCTGSRKTVYKRNSNSDIVITLVVRTDCTGDFVLNGNANCLTASDFREMTSNNYYSYCRKNVSQYVPANGLMTIENTNVNGYYQLGVFSSSSGTCSYGYFSDYQQYATATFDMDDTYCTGDDIVFNFTVENLDEVTLVLPDGSTMNQPPFVLNSVQTGQAGTYYLQGEVCNGVQILDEIDIKINGPTTETVNLSGCEEASWHGFVFDHDMDTTVIIHNPNDCDSIFNLHVELAGSYQANIDLIGCGQQEWNGFVFDHTVDTIVVIENPNDCDSVYDVHVEITKTSMEIQGMTIIAVTSDLWPGVYNYCVSNQDLFEACDISWTCSNPDWQITPFADDPRWVRLIASTLGDATLRAEATCPTGCNATATITLNASCIGIDELDDNDITVYPNPANGDVVIKGELIKQVTFYNCYGQKCLDIESDMADEIEIHTDNLIDGFYFVDILTAKGRTVKRLVVTK